MESSAEGAALIHTIVQMARDLNLNTVAEGIETTETVDAVAARRMQKRQGYCLLVLCRGSGWRELLEGSHGSDVILQPSSASRS